MRFLRSALLLVACMTIGLSTRAAATPIAYSESVSGDLGIAQPFTQFTLDAGANTVSGTSHFFPTNSDVDTDSFAFEVPAGMELLGVSYSFVMTPLPGTTETIANTVYQFDNGAAPVFPFLGQESLDLLGPATVNPFASALPQGAGIYSLNQFSVTSSSNSGWTSDYTWTLTVGPTADAVPEPMSLLLVGTGLLGVARRRSRGRRG